MKVACCGIGHKNLHAIENSNEVAMPKMLPRCKSNLQQQLQHVGTYQLCCVPHVAKLLTHGEGSDSCQIVSEGSGKIAVTKMEVSRRTIHKQL